MSTYDTVEMTLASAVADAGTFTVGYPDKRDAGDYRGGIDHQVVSFAYGELKELDGDVSFAFGASNITVTNNTGQTLASGTDIIVQLDRMGSNAFTRELADPSKMVRTDAILVNMGAPDAADADGAVASQACTAASGLATGINGALASGGVATFDVPRNIVAAWTGTAVLTVTGTDAYGSTMVESSASGTSHTGAKAFKTVTDVSVSADVTGLTIGTGDVLGLPFFLAQKGEILQKVIDGKHYGIMDGENVFLQDRMLEAAVDAGTAHNIVSPVAGRIKKLTTICQSAVTTGGAITVEVNTVAVDGLSLTIADAAAEGEVDSDTPTADHATAVVAVGDRIEIIPAAAFNASADIYFILEIEPEDGEFVVGDTTTPSATTGDVRGTWAPEITPDGSTDMQLLVVLGDANYKGATQYAG